MSIKKAFSSEILELNEEAFDPILFVAKSRLMDVMKRLKEQFDLVFLDPPYSLELWEELALLADPLIQNNGYIYVEADRDLNLLKLPASWVQVKNTKAGTVRAGLYQKKVVVSP